MVLKRTVGFNSTFQSVCSDCILDDNNNTNNYVLRSLHWLPVLQCILFKTLLHFHSLGALNLHSRLHSSVPTYTTASLHHHRALAHSMNTTFLWTPILVLFQGHTTGTLNAISNFLEYFIKFILLFCIGDNTDVYTQYFPEFCEKCGFESHPSDLPFSL